MQVGGKNSANKAIPPYPNDETKELMRSAAISFTRERPGRVSDTFLDPMLHHAHTLGLIMET